LAIQNLQRALLADTRADQTPLHHRDVLGRLRDDIAQPPDHIVERQAGMRGLFVGLLDAAHRDPCLFRAHVYLHAVAAPATAIPKNIKRAGAGS
jgi:hypothetical protein